MFLHWVCISTNWELKHWFGLGRTCAIVYPSGTWNAWNRACTIQKNGKCSYVYQALKEARLSIRGMVFV